MMKRLLLFPLFFVLLVWNALGQSLEAEPQKAVAEQLEKNYNADDHEAIFSAFSTAMQEALPIQETKKFVAGYSFCFRRFYVAGSFVQIGKFVTTEVSK